MLDIYLEKLNAAVASHNAEVEDLLERQQIGEAEAIGLRWTKPVTRQTVHDAEYASGWPDALLNIVGDLHTEISAYELHQLAKSVKRPTLITRDLCKGSGAAKGAKDPDYPHPVHIKLIHAAHLFARAEPEAATKPKPEKKPE